MEISQHIKNLLKTNERVILKGFGVFTTKHIPARIDKETKIMKPPFKIVVFDDSVTEDAGLLIKHMAEKERISIDNAKEQIDEYVKTIKSKLSAGKNVEFKDLGSFSQKPGDKIEFSYLSEDNLLLDSFGLPTVTISDQDKFVSKPIEKKQPIKAPVEKKPVEKKRVEQKPQVVKADEKKKPIKQKPVRQKPVKQKPVKDGKKRKKRPFLFGLLIFIGAIAVMLTAIYFFKPDLWDKGYAYISPVKNKIAGWINGDDSGNYKIITNDDINEDNEIENDEIVDTNTIDENINNNTDQTDENNNDLNETEENVSDNTVDNNSDNNETVDVTVNETPNNAQKGRYYIIVGSVVSESSAQKEQKRFANKGITTNIIYVPGMNRYRISIGDFGSAKDAQDYYSNFQNKHGNIEAWVWEKR